MLATLLDASASLGVGVADANGLLVEAHGLHDGCLPEAVAAHLSHSRSSALETLLNDTLEEQILLGERYCFYLRWLPERPYFAYVMTRREAARSGLRHSLKGAVADLGLSFGARSAPPLRERLEQPRQFLRDALVR